MGRHLRESKNNSAWVGSCPFDKGNFVVPESTAVDSRQFESSIKLSKGSAVLEDLLPRVEEHSTVKITADASTFVGEFMWIKILLLRYN